jgi:DegV family protein with EDD domain
MVKIVTDVEAGLAPELMERFGIKTIPLWVHFGEESYQEGVNLTREDFYERLTSSSEFPKTSQASVGQFMELYRSIVEAGHEIVSIHISSKLSGTYQSASEASKQLPEAKIDVVDSLQASLAESILVWRAAEWAEVGLNREEIVARLQPMIKHTRLLFMVDTLEYLRRGGRIGGAAALLGTLLQVKPILTLTDGVIDTCDKARTRKRALARLKDLVLEAAGENTGVDLCVVHVQCLEAAETLAEKLSAELKPRRLFIDLMGPGIGAHVGPGTIGVAIYCDEWAVRSF